MAPRPNYLTELVLQVAEGWGKLPEQQRKSHASWLLAQQQPNGGFAGREGGSDLYYTAFAVRSLAVLGELHGTVAESCADFLARHLQGNASVIDLISLVMAAKQIEMASGIDPLAEADQTWGERLARLLEGLRTSDGGYAKAAEGKAGSTYQTFLATLVYELLELPLPTPERAAEFLLSQQRDDGGFVEIRVMRRSGVNPTAAAVGGLAVLESHHATEGLSRQRRENVAEFLAEMQNEEGGMLANTRIPIADLLSTFTGLQTLSTLGRLDLVSLPAVEKFATGVEQPAGGFLAASWDQQCDVEYTFYGIGVCGLVAAAR